MSRMKIGIFRALYLGDLLCMIPAVRAIRHAWPDAMIVLIGLPWAKSFAERFSHYFDGFFEFPGWPGLPEREGEPGAVVDFLLHMQAQSFDLVIQMHGNGERSNSICRLFKGKKLAGLRRPGEYCPDTESYALCNDDDHEILRFMRVVDALRIKGQGHDLEFPFGESDEKNFLSASTRMDLQRDRYICIHPGARQEKKRWPASRFADVGDRLAEQGHQIVLTGSEAERSLLKSVEERMRYKPVNIVEQAGGDVPLGFLGMVIRHAALLIANDTGVSHIASALAVPSVIIFSHHSSINRWSPLDKALHHVVLPEESRNTEAVLRSAYALLSVTAR